MRCKRLNLKECEESCSYFNEKTWQKKLNSSKNKKLCKYQKSYRNVLNEMDVMMTLK